MGESALRICQVASELAPFAKTGGLGDVTAGLSRALGKAGHDVRIFPPFYARIAKMKHDFVAVDFLRDFEITLGARKFTVSVLTTKLPQSDVDVYLVHCPALYHHDSIYSGEWDEYLRYALLTRAALDSCQRMGWAPDVVHAHDWHTALAPIYLRTVYSWDRLFASTRTVLTLHNLAYQGVYSSQILDDLGLAPFSAMLYNEDLSQGRVSFLKTGLLYADVLTTVSRTYAREIQTAEFGFGLDSLLRARADHLVGIVNGVDYGEWNPEVDPYIPHRFSPDGLEGKAAMKKALLEKVALPWGKNAPVVGLVSASRRRRGSTCCSTPCRSSSTTAISDSSRWGAARSATSRSSRGCRSPSPARPGTSAATAKSWRTGSKPDRTCSSCHRGSSRAVSTRCTA
ncbi:MAG: glycogen/starch synthase [Thermoanaerobaculia bacterium]